MELKEVKRKGWIDTGILDPEDVADHSWSTAMLALALTPDELDVNKVVGLALIHDLAEIRTGDITPYDGISDSEKKDAEADAIVKLKKISPENICRLLDEYKSHSTAEAKFAKDLDLLEMVLQADRYERLHGADRPNWTFWEYAQERIRHPLIKKIFKDLKNERIQQ